MIAIVNTATFDGEDTIYNLQINRDLLCTFKHRRDDGLAVCLERAAKAAKEYEVKELKEILDAIKER